MGNDKPELGVLGKAATETARIRIPTEQGAEKGQHTAGRLARGTNVPPVEAGHDGGGHFEGVEQVHACVEVSPSKGQAKELLSCAQLWCQRIESPHTGRSCLSCPHMINFRPSQDGKSLTISCLWTDEDSAESLATYTHEVAFVDPTATVAEATRLVDQQGVRYLGVSSNEELIGIVCRCDLALASGDHEVQSCMSSPVVWVPAEAHLSQVVKEMEEHQLGVLPVAKGLSSEGRKLGGFVTKSSLAQVGLGHVLDQCCAACGSHEDVHTHPRLRSVNFCLDCLNQEGTPIDYDELGFGD